MIRVVLPQHLRVLASVDGEMALDLAEPITINAVLEALEARYPMLKGTILEHDTQARRPRVRFYAARRDLTHESYEEPLPAEVREGATPFLIVGAVAGG